MEPSPGSGRCTEGFVVVAFSLANLPKTEFKAFALAVAGAVWGQYCLAAEGCATSQRGWKNGKTGRKWEKSHETAQVVKILTWAMLLWCGRRDLLLVVSANVS